MKTMAGKEKAEEIYQDWVQGNSVRVLEKKYRISRQRIYRILKDYKGIGDKEKMLRAVNKLSLVRSQT